MTEFKVSQIVEIPINKNDKENIYKGEIISIDTALVSSDYQEYLIKFSFGEKLYTKENLLLLVSRAYLLKISKPTNFDCNFCKKTIDKTDWSELEHKEFKISAMCAPCQRKFFI